MNKKLIVGNWKMNPETREEALFLVKKIKKIASRVKKSDMIVCPPFVFLSEVGCLFKGSKVSLGAQDLFWEANGPFTGEISGEMLKDLRVKFVIIGHSERRALGENDKTINKKIKASLRNKIIPIICVGERERDSHGYYLAAVKEQIEHAFEGVPATMLRNIIIAYEPVWAIGASAFKSATPESAVEMGIFIKKTLADRYGPRRVHDVKILYGGSVNSKNAGEFLKEKDISGLLVGRESLDAEKFMEITNKV